MIDHDLARMATFFRPHYGHQTEALFKALCEPPPKVALLNPHLSKKSLESVLGTLPTPSLLGSQFCPLDKDKKPTLIEGLVSHYFLDPSSVLAPSLLPFASNTKVLDMCAAPGGKLLVMQSLLRKNVQFFANDISAARYSRLRRAVTEFLPATVRETIIFSCRDATFFGLKQKAQFDAVLLDAPCSSEGHVVRDQSLLKKFSGPKKNLCMRQYSLLSAALLALKPGGHVMYATCSINPAENDGVIKKILTKKHAQCALVEVATPYGIKSEYGVTILPHLHNAGPAFFSLLKRL